MRRVMRILTFTTLYPNAAAPGHGVFVEERLRHVAMRDDVALRVVAPIPWFPSSDRRFGRYAQYAAAPVRERRHGIDIQHPRYPVIPKVGMGLAPDLLYRWTAAAAARTSREMGGAQLIDAHYFYPDGVAAARLAARLGVPFVVTARGADLNRIGRLPGPARRILQTAAAAAAIITVSRSLKDRLVDMGGPAEKIHVIPNGVDLEKFHPLTDREALRRKYLANEDETLIVSVGQLIERKGHHLTIEALGKLPGCRLTIAGEGPERAALAALAVRLGVADRVSFLGRVAHEDLPSLYGAADLMVLASSSEGMANVMLESLACGAPVVATPVDGALEVIRSPASGKLTPARSAGALAETVKAVLRAMPSRAETRRIAEGFPWIRAAEAQVALYHSILSG